MAACSKKCGDCRQCDNSFAQIVIDEQSAEIKELSSWREDMIGRLEHYTGTLWPDEVCSVARSLLQDFGPKRPPKKLDSA